MAKTGGSGSGPLGSIWTRLNARLGNPLDWSHANRALLIIVPTIIFQSSYIWLEHSRADALNLPESVLRLRDQIDLYRTLIWGPLLAAALWLRRSERSGRFFLYVTSLVWYVDLGLANVIYEPLTTFIWITTVAVTLLLLIIVDWNTVIIGVGLFILVSESPAVLSLFGHEAYAPVFSQATDLGPLLRMDWGYRLFTLLLFLTAIVIFMYTVAQWRDREQSLALAMREVDGAKQGLEKRVSERTAELKSAYEALVASEQNWETLFRNAPDYIAVVTREGVIDTVNRVPDGLTVEIVRGRRVSDFIQPPFIGSLMAAVERVFAGGQAESIELEYALPGGILLYLEARVSLVGSQNSADRAILIGTDVSERHEAAKRQRTLEEKMREKQRLESLGILAGGIAHDFNNLLTPVIGQTGLLLRELPQDSQLRGPIRDIEAAASRGAEIIRQLLGYVGRSPIEKKIIDLNTLVTDMTRLLKLAVPGNSTLDISLASGLLLMNADPAQIRQVLMNLITNASEALDGAPGIVRISTHREYLDGSRIRNDLGGAGISPGYFASIEISDTGKGMDEETLSRIFDPFFTTKSTGHGLGLAFLQGIIKAHEGTVSVASRPGEGTVFRVFIPLAENTAAVPAEPVRPGAPPIQGTILVVDDEPLNCTVATRILQRAGAETLSAEGGGTGARTFSR